MRGIYWQKLILHSAHTVGETLCLDFQPMHNALLTSGLRFDPCFALAATLFGFNNASEYHASSASAFPFTMAELFFLAEEQYYHVQRSLNTKDVHLHRWEESHWSVLFSGSDDYPDISTSNAYRTVIKELLGIVDAQAWYTYTCFTGDISLPLAESIAHIRAGLPPYHCAEDALRQRVEILVTKKRIPLEQEIETTRSIYQQAILVENDIRNLNIQLKDLRSEHQKDLRQMHRFHTIENAIHDWQQHAERAKQLSHQAAMLRQAEQALAPLVEEQHFLDIEIQRVCQAFNTTPEVLQNNVESATTRRDELQAAEDDYLQAERRLTRFGAQPLSPDLLLPIIERRLELLHYMAQEQAIQPTRGIGQRQALLLSMAITLLASGLYFAFSGQELSWTMVLLGVMLGLVCGVIAWKLIPKENILGELQHHPLHSELQAQAQQIGNLSLMDRDALAAFATQLRQIEPLRRNRPSPEQLEHALADYHHYQQQLASSLSLFTQSQANMQAIHDIQHTHHIEISIPLPEQIRFVSEQLSRELGAWRRQAAPYVDLPEIRPQDLDTTWREFAALNEAREQMQHRLRDFAHQEEAILLRLAQASQSATPTNIALTASQLIAMEKQLTHLDGDIAAAKLAHAWLQQALEDDAIHAATTVVSTYRDHEDPVLASLAAQLAELVPTRLPADNPLDLWRHDQTPDGETLLSLLLLIWCASAANTPKALPLIVRSVHITNNDMLNGIWHILEHIDPERQKWLLAENAHGQQDAYWQSIVKTQSTSPS